MRILVTGRNGQLASALLERGADTEGFDVIAVGRPDFDLEDRGSIEGVIGALRPDLVVNAAAFTAVDRAEQEAGRAYAVNATGAGAAASAAARRGLPFIHISTDYVFSGEKAAPYVETDATGPVNVYGRSKLAGEWAVMAAHPSPLILRTSWVYSPFGANFVKSMLRLGATRPLLGVVDDQHGNPTSALDLADAILRVAPGLKEGGTYHLSGSGETSWCGFAREIFALGAACGAPVPEVSAITTAEYPTPARRPANSRLSTAAFEARFGFALRCWRAGLADVMPRLVTDGQQEAAAERRAG